MNQEQYRCVILCGLPGSGKTTIRNQVVESDGDTKVFVVSSDDTIEKYAADNGISYSAAWELQKLNINRDIQRQVGEIKQFIYDNPNVSVSVVWDQTNLLASKRKKISEMLGDGFTYFILFATESMEHVLILERNQSRVSSSRDLHPNVIQDMAVGMQIPHSWTDGWADFIGFANSDGDITVVHTKE